jgi:hypothetical protein
MKDYKKLYEDLLKEHEETVKLLEDVVYHAKEVVLENEALKMKKVTQQTNDENSPYNCFINEISSQTEKENSKNIWENSDFKDLPKLQSNNVGIVGEKFIEKICKKTNIESSIDGTKTKKLGGDGLIKNKKIEIKTAHIGNNLSSFQHELGEKPWLADYMVFLDIETTFVYLTIFKNFTEEHYKSGNKCTPIFPNKKITQRKGMGAFKLDTSININELCVKNGNSIKITKSTSFRDLYKFINKIIK